MKRQKVRGKKRSGGVSIDVCDINLFITEFHASYSVSPKLFSSILLHAHGGYLLSLSLAARSYFFFLSRCTHLSPLFDGQEEEKAATPKKPILNFSDHPHRLI